MCGRAAAAASLLTVTRTNSEPARASAATCWMVPGISAVSVLVMDWTAMGASLPMRTPPTLAVWVFLRRKIAMEVLVYHVKMRALGPRVSLALGRNGQADSEFFA